MRRRTSLVGRFARALLIKHDHVLGHAVAIETYPSPKQVDSAAVCPYSSTGRGSVG